MTQAHKSGQGTDGQRGVLLGSGIAGLGRGLSEGLVQSLFINLLALAAPIFVLQVYDRVVFYAGVSTLTALASGMAVVLVFDYALRMARSRLLQRAALNVEVGLSRRLFDRLASLPLGELERRPAAYWQILFRDVETVRNTIAGPLVILFADLPFALLFLLCVAIVAQPIVWALIVVALCFVLLAFLSGRTAEALGDRERQAAIGRDNFVAELVDGRAGLKAVGGIAALRETWETRQAAVIASAIQRGGRADALHNLSHVLTVATTVALTSVGALAIVEQQMTVGSLIAANMLANRIVAPLAQLVASWRMFVACRQSLHRLREIFALPEERTQDAMELARPSGEMVVEGASYAYGTADRPVLKDLRLRFAPGTYTALVGPNGGGKTTLLKLLAGLYTPAAGRILLDGADIAQFSRERLRRWIAYVPQEPLVVSGSIRDNVALGHDEVEDDAIVAAATAVGLHQTVLDMPDGYGTEAGEAGSRLSGGMRQRIALARALIGAPVVLLLDEPTNNLDRAGEEALRETLLQLAGTTTLVVATHAPSLLAASQQILVLQGGRVALGGPAADVMQRLGAGQPRPASARGTP
ncbi:MAG: ATP-binding cassette domain-containing protein [Alphaproteobacteria bacterium]|nr:ATP-binding cassette domain-containing protein [Alphaproteobacteria bacterium]